MPQDSVYCHTLVLFEVYEENLASHNILFEKEYFNKSEITTDILL